MSKMIRVKGNNEKQEFLSLIRGYNNKEKLIFIVEYIRDYWGEILLDDELHWTVSRSFSLCVHRLRKQYSLYSYSDIIKNKISILDKYDILGLSVLIIEKEIWEELVIHELSLLRKEEINFRLNYYVGCIEELDLLLRQIGVFNFYDYPEYFDLESFVINESQTYKNAMELKRYFEELGNGIEVVMDEFFIVSKSDFSIPIQEYSNFLRSIDIQKIESYLDIDREKYLKNIELELLSRKSESKMLVISDKYRQKDLLRIMRRFSNTVLTNIDFKDFIINSTVYEKSMPDDYYLKIKKVENKKLHLLSKEEVSDMIGFFKYLKEKKVIIDSRKNSGRKMAKIILNYFKTDSSLEFETLRKKFYDDSVSLSKQIQMDLNYYLD